MDIIPPPVEIGLIDLPKSGGALVRHGTPSPGSDRPAKHQTNSTLTYIPNLIRLLKIELGQPWSNLPFNVKLGFPYAHKLYIPP